MILLLSCTSAFVLTNFLYCLLTCRPIAFRCARPCSSALGSFADCHVCRCHSRLAWLGLAWLGLVAIVQVLDQRLASVDRLTPIMMYCTGGIRCVKARGIAQ